MDRGAWRATVHAVAESNTAEQLNNHQPSSFQATTQAVRVPLTATRPTLQTHTPYICTHTCHTHVHRGLLNFFKF